MRRLLMLVLGSAILISACGSAKVLTTPASSPTHAAGANPSDSPAASPTQGSLTVNPASSFVMQDGDWIVFGPDASGFTTKFPAAPTLASSTTTTAAGDAPTSIWKYEQGGNLIYYVMLVNYPTGSLTGVDTAQVYDRGVNGMVGGDANLALAAQGDVTLNGHLGRSFLLTSALGSLQGSTYLVGDNLFMAYVAYTSSVDPAFIQTFLADFQLTN